MAKKKESMIEHDKYGKIIVENEAINDGEIGSSCEDWVCLQSANKNLYRAMPSMIDGLKPVHRRILYTMYKCGCMTELKKVQKICGLVSDIHPHGDTSGSLGAMGQTFSNNIPFIKGKGNFGSVNGDTVGQARYIEATLSDFSKIAFFKDFDIKTVDTRDSYTMESVEPEFLPARYPVALINGMLSSIGTGFSSNIPPYNFQEVCEQTIALVNNPEADVYLVPDLPTGADVIDDGRFHEISETGKGSFTAQSTYYIDHEANVVHITSIPIQMTVDKIISGIAELKQKKAIPEIKNIANITSKHASKNKAAGVEEVDLVLYLDQTANPESVMEKLLKTNIGLRKAYPIDIIMIDNFKMKFYSIRSFLLAWIDWRKDFLRSFYNNKLVSVMEEKHMNDVCIKIFNGQNIEKTATMAKNSANAKEFAESLVKEYDITSLQATTISNMKYSAFTKEAYTGYLEKRKKCEEDIEKYRRMLYDESLIDKELIEQLEDGIKRFGYPRKSKIIKLEGTIENTKHVIGISTDGYIKKVGIKDAIGSIGKSGGKLCKAIQIKNRSNLILFDELGMVYKIPVFEIPDASSKSSGYPLTRYIKDIGNVIFMMEEQSKSDIKKYGLEIISITANGYAKKLSMKKINKSDKFTTLYENDRAVSVLVASQEDNEDLLICTSDGKGIRLNTADIPTFKKGAKGLKQITLDEGVEVIGATHIDSTKPYLAYITMNGKFKLTDSHLLPVSKRKGDLFVLIPLDTNDKLIGITSVNRDDKITVYHKYSDSEVVSVVDLPVSLRIAKPTKIVKTGNGDIILGFSVN
nr:MAG TPA: DNA topoisomerase 2 alpha [Caudoviricetes sp.]